MTSDFERQHNDKSCCLNKAEMLEKFSLICFKCVKCIQFTVNPQFNILNSEKSEFYYL